MQSMEEECKRVLADRRKERLPRVFKSSSGRTKGSDGSNLIG